MMLDVLWKNFYEQVHSWTYVTVFLLLLAGVGHLSLFRRRRWLPVVHRVVAFLLLGGVLASLFPRIVYYIDLNPLPLTAFSHSIVLPIYYGAPAIGMFVLLAVIMISTLAGGRLFCGWVCPVGFVQELTGKLRRRRLRVIPMRVGVALRIGLLIVFGGLLAWKSVILYDWIDPAKAFDWRGWNSTAVWLPFAFLVFASFIVHRPFCSAVCPVGLLAWAFERISLLELRVTATCNRCGDCLTATPCASLSQKVGAGRQTSDCFACGECVRECERDAIRWAWRYKREARRRESVPVVRAAGVGK